MTHMHEVIATIQSPGNEPVEMRWYRGDNPLHALVAVGQNLLHGEDTACPPSVRPTLLSVRIDITQEDA